MVKMAKYWMRSGGSELTVFERVLGYFLCGWMMNDWFSSSPPNQLPLASLFLSLQLATIALLSSFIPSQGQRKTCLHLSQKVSFQFQQSICYPKAIWWLNWQCRQLIFELHHSKWWLCRRLWWWYAGKISGRGISSFFFLLPILQGLQGHQLPKVDSYIP